MNIVKDTKLAKKRKMGMVRKNSFLTTVNGYLVPFDNAIYGYGAYIPFKGYIVRMAGITTKDILAKDWILVKRIDHQDRAYSIHERVRQKEKHSKEC